MPDPLPVLYRDDSLVVVNKPSGLAVHRGWADDDHYALDLVRDQIGQYLYPVHRLDRATSGALLFALSATDAKILQMAFEASEVGKCYLALTRGVTPESGVVDHPIPRTEAGPRVPACTHYWRMATWERYSWVAVAPKSGRLHQIRRHLKHINHPLIGDVRYGKGEHNRLFRTRFAFARLALHACALAFAHPRTAKRLQICAPLPDDFHQLLTQMDLSLSVQAVVSRALTGQNLIFQDPEPAVDGPVTSNHR